VKPLGALLAVGGGILVLIGFIWGWVVGYYPSELPVIIVLLLIGAGALWLGSKLYSSAPDSPSAARPPVSQAPSTHWLAASAPTATTSTAHEPATANAPTDAEIGPDTSAGRLAGLAANPRLWPQIEAHPNAYPALLEWIREQRAGGTAEASDAVARASDPATPPSELAELAERHPELRAAIAVNPAAYPALREWIAKNGPE
jgi:hypothetical protein